MLKDRVKCAVPNPGGPIGVGSTVALGAASAGFRTFLTAFGAAAPAFFVLSDGAGKALSGAWTVNGDGTATITAILLNDRLGDTSAETFSSACVAWCALPAGSAPGLVLSTSTLAAMRAAMGVPAIPTAAGGVGQVEPILTAAATPYSLPAGGQWFYQIFGVHTSTGALGAAFGTSVQGGGTLIFNGVTDFAWRGFVWRIA